jgi:hypothetical protein
MLPVGFDLAMEATRRTARSALPDAPRRHDVPDPRPPAPAAGVRLRFAMAAGLRTLAAASARTAERVDPCGRYVPVPPIR